MTVLDFIEKYNINILEVFEGDVTFWYKGSDEPMCIDEYILGSQIVDDFYSVFYYADEKDY
jgi:hypothetical protein